VSKTNTVKELKLAIESFDLSPAQVREIVINGFKRSFFYGPYVQRREYVRRAVAHYDQVAAQHGIVSGPAREEGEGGGREQGEGAGRGSREW
jgi:adenosine deaminase